MKFFTKKHLLTVLVISTVCTQLHAAEIDWNNSSTNFNAPGSYNTTAGAANTAALTTSSAT